MAKINVNIEMDEDLIREFDEFCDEIGLEVSSAMSLFAKTVVRQRRIPFELSSDIPNAETIAAMKEVDDIINGKIETKVYSDIDELFEDLNDAI